MRGRFSQDGNALNENEQAMKDFGKSADDANGLKTGRHLETLRFAIGAVAVAAGAAAVKMGKEVVKQFGEGRTSAVRTCLENMPRQFKSPVKEAYKNRCLPKRYLATANKMGCVPRFRHRATESLS